MKDADLVTHHYPNSISESDSFGKCVILYLSSGLQQRMGGGAFFKSVKMLIS